MRFSDRSPTRATAPVASIPPSGPVVATAKRNWLLPLAEPWPDAAHRQLMTHGAVVRVIVAGVKGSAPRERGACMLVSPTHVVGTIGGGNLEWQATQIARRMLLADASAPVVRIERLILGAQLGQCCGGVVELWMERFTSSDRPILKHLSQACDQSSSELLRTQYFDTAVARSLVQGAAVELLPECERDDATALLREDSTETVRFLRAGVPKEMTLGAVLLERLNPRREALWLYGAGHVGQALVRLLAELPLAVTWIDSRADLFPEELPDNVRAVCTDTPADLALRAPSDVCHLVMTHDHTVDYQICRALLAHGAFAWIGLIGSASKGARFRSRLRRDGIQEAILTRLVCPIGVEGVSGKLPAAIAVSVAAQLLRILSCGEPLGRTRGSVVSSAAESPDPADCSPERCRSCASATHSPISRPQSQRE